MKVENKMKTNPVKDAVFATFSSGFWIMVDWDEDSLTWTGKPLWFAREEDNLIVGLVSNEGMVRELEDVAKEHWRHIYMGHARWVEAGPNGLLCSHLIKLEADPQKVQQEIPSDYEFEKILSSQAVA